MTNEEIRKVAVQADSILSLVWHRYLHPEVQGDPHYNREYREAITGLRRIQKHLEEEQ